MYVECANTILRFEHEKNTYKYSTLLYSPGWRARERERERESERERERERERENAGGLAGGRVGM